MARWEPDAPGRLELAALELFAERGYEGTTVEDIATRAGVTKRTFFRHYPDKREVLFGGGDTFERSCVDSLAEAPPDLGPLDAVAHALTAVAASFGPRADWARRRHGVIAANPALRERELVKLASVSAALAAGLRERGVADPAAGLLSDAAMAVFGNAYDRWAVDPAADLAQLVGESLQALRAAAAA